MMTDEIELRDTEAAQQYLLQSWALARAGKLTLANLNATLAVALELANEGQALAPLGFCQDLVSIFSGAQTISTNEAEKAWEAPAPDASLLRRYEDYVLGKFAADMSLERATDELQKYKDYDRVRALAFAVQQVQLRAGVPRVIIGPAVIKAMLSLSSPALQAMYFQSIADGPSSMIVEQWDELIQAVRNCGELLGPEDIFELASGTALSKFGQRLALRQVLQAGQYLVVGLPKQKPTGRPRHHVAATNILEEDLYPVGGFSSIANRGTMESLLRSELAYMEDGQRPDLFDIKYARDELLYYSRDENQFFRRRVTVVFVLDSSLSIARVKDSGAAWQRIVLTMATILTMVQTLTDWLSSDALHFEIAFLSELANGALREEQEVIQTLFRDEIQAGRLTFTEVNVAKLRSNCIEYVRKSLCQCVYIHAQSSNKVDAWLDGDKSPSVDSAWRPLLVELDVSQTIPRVAYDQQVFTFEDSADPWRETLRTLLGTEGGKGWFMLG